MHRADHRRSRSRCGSAAAPTSRSRAPRVSATGGSRTPTTRSQEAREQAAFYLAQCDELGRVPTAIAIRRDVHVGASAEDAARVAEPVISAGYRGFPPEACTYGDAEAVADALRAYADAGFTDVIVRQLADDQSDALASIERLADVRALLA